MDLINTVLNNIKGSYINATVTTSVLISVLCVTFVLCIYEFTVYRLVSRRAFYNRSFNISISVLPFFVATIILCLQSNSVITLGTIGALAIIRFRTAVKDPVDMIYLFWAIHIGITCGCQLYEVAVITSAVVTVVLLVMENTALNKKPVIMVFDQKTEKEDGILALIKKEGKNAEVKSRSYSEDHVHYVIEVPQKNSEPLINSLRSMGVEQLTVVSYDEDNIV